MTVKTYAQPTAGMNYSELLTHTGYGQGSSMDPLSAIIGVGGSILGGLFGKSAAEKQNIMAAKVAREQMDFQEKMSNTAYTRAAKDMERAGLNRILALGRPASSPGGAMPPVVNEGQAGINTALAVARQTAEIRNIKANTAKTVAETSNVGLTGGQIFQQTEKYRQEVSNLQKTGQLIAVQTQVQDALRKIRNSEGIIIKSEADLWEAIQSVDAGEAGVLTKYLGPHALKLVLLALSGRK